MLLRIFTWIRKFTQNLTSGTQVDTTRSGLKVWQRLMPFLGGDQGTIRVVSDLHIAYKVLKTY